MIFLPKQSLMRKMGFTLLEMMIAVAIVAISLSAILVIISRTHTNSAHLHATLAADMAAREVLDSFRLDLPADKKPVPTDTTGSIDMGGHSFTYTTTLTPAGDGGLVKLDVAMRTPAQGAVVRILSTYIARPAAE